MTRKEINEIKSQFNIEDCGILRLCGCYVDGEKNRIIQNDISGTISVKGSGNVAGNGNIVTNNYYYADSEKKCEKSILKFCRLFRFAIVFCCCLLGMEK